MQSFIIGIFIIAVAGILSVWYRRARKQTRTHFIQTYVFPTGLMSKLGEKRPDLSANQRALVGRGLKQFFRAHANSGQFVSMPSQVADDLWHEFILYTKAYEEFCKRAFGKFMHHTPAAVLGRHRHNNEGLRRVWCYACRQENIDPHEPSRLPLLFALDSQLGIADGFAYQPQCEQLRRNASGGAFYCGGDFSDSSYDGGLSGFGDASAGDSSHSGPGGDSGDTGGGDGGDCGGGCGGGD